MESTDRLYEISQNRYINNGKSLSKRVGRKPEEYAWADKKEPT